VETVLNVLIALAIVASEVAVLLWALYKVTRKYLLKDEALAEFKDTLT
jgi:hypothetical protein